MNTLYPMNTTGNPDPWRDLKEVWFRELEHSWIGEFVEGLNLWLWEKGWIEF